MMNNPTNPGFGSGQQGFGQWTPGWQGFGGGFGPGWQGWQGGWGFNPYGYGSYGGGFVPSTAGYGLGGLRRWGGTYSPQFTSTGLPTDEEIEEMVYDSLDDDPMIPWDADIEVKVDAGEVTLTGTVPNKRIKHAAGDDAWWITGVTDVHNQIKVQGRHKGRAKEEEEAAPAPTTLRRGMRGGR